MGALKTVEEPEGTTAFKAIGRSDVLQNGSQMNKSTSKEDLAFFMREALKEGENAFATGGYGIGAVLVLDGEIIARAGAETHTSKDPRAHAETRLFDKIDVKGFTKDDFGRMTVVTTLESCIMCYGTFVILNVGRVVYGMKDEPSGFTPPPEVIPEIHRDQMPEVIGGVLEKECSELFKRNRAELDERYKSGNLFV